MKTKLDALQIADAYAEVKKAKYAIEVLTKAGSEENETMPILDVHISGESILANAPGGYIVSRSIIAALLKFWHVRLEQRMCELNKHGFE